MKIIKFFFAVAFGQEFSNEGSGGGDEQVKSWVNPNPQPQVTSWVNPNPVAQVGSWVNPNLAPQVETVNNQVKSWTPKDAEQLDTYENYRKR